MAAIQQLTATDQRWLSTDANKVLTPLVCHGTNKQERDRKEVTENAEGGERERANEREREK